MKRGGALLLGEAGYSCKSTAALFFLAQASDFAAQAKQKAPRMQKVKHTRNQYAVACPEGVTWWWWGVQPSSSCCVSASIARWRSRVQNGSRLPLRGVLLVLRSQSAWRPLQLCMYGAWQDPWVTPHLNTHPTIRAHASKTPTNQGCLPLGLLRARRRKKSTLPTSSWMEESNKSRKCSMQCVRERAGEPAFHVYYLLPDQEASFPQPMVAASLPHCPSSFSTTPMPSCRP